MKLSSLPRGFIAVCYELSASSGLRNRKAALTRVNKAPKRSLRDGWRIIQALGSDLEKGLDVFEAKHWQERFGPNVLTQRKGQGSFLLFLLQFHQSE